MTAHRKEVPPVTDAQRFTLIWPPALIMLLSLAVLPFIQHPFVTALVALALAGSAVFTGMILAIPTKEGPTHV